MTGTVSLINDMQNNIDDLATRDKEMYQIINQYTKRHNINLHVEDGDLKYTIEDFIKLANLYESLEHGIVSNLVQINKFDWIDSKTMDRFVTRLKNQNISNRAKYEVP